MTADGADAPLDQAAYVMSSRYRRIAVETLADGPSTPTQIARTDDLQQPHVSRALSELQERDLVTVHGDQSRTKLYALTDRGQEVVALLDDVGGDE